LKACFITVARIITFDTVTYFENRAVSKGERREIVRKLLDEMNES